MKIFAINRFSEASTYRGLLVLAGLVGVTLTPDQKEAIITVCLALYGVIGAFFPDKFGKDSTKNTSVGVNDNAVDELPKPIRAKPIAQLRDSDGGSLQSTRTSENQFLDK